MTAASAVQRLALSKLAPANQLQGLRDISVDDFRLEMRNRAGIELETVVTDARIRRTVEGASALTISIDDDLQRTVQRSKRLGRKVDFNLDGLFFTLVAVKKNRRNLSLILEDREVNTLRYYTQFLKVSRDTMTRAQFVLRLVQEGLGPNVPYYIPELDVKQTVSDLGPGQSIVDGSGLPLNSDASAALGNRAQGIAYGSGVTVKGTTASREQVDNATTILNVATQGFSTSVRKVMVCAIMTAIQESSITNLVGGDLDSVGVFQQRASQGWPASRNVAVDAKAFLDRAAALNNQYPNLGYGELCSDVQHDYTFGTSRQGADYDQWRSEAEAIVTAYGVTGGAVASAPDDATSYGSGTPLAGLGGGDYEFTRGILSQDGQGQFILTKENSWQCIQRLAGEVNWRAFFVSGKFYFIRESLLLKSKPLIVINEDYDGVDWIDFDYDEGKAVATVTVTAHVSRWSAPPGSVVQIKDQAHVVNGRYIVNDIDRSLYDTVATITLKKPLPILPEPTSNTSGIGAQASSSTTTTPDQGAGQYKVGSPLVQPIPQQYNKGHGGYHDTLGLPGYPALDFFADPGSPIISCESGTVHKLSGYDPSLGWVEGVGGPLGWSVYVKGDTGSDYYYTHMDQRIVAIGQKVSVGQKLGTVAAMAGRDSHVHLGVSPADSGYSIQDVAGALEAVNG